MTSVSKIRRVFHSVGRFVCLFLITTVLAACNQPHEFAGTELQEQRVASEIIGTNWNGESFQLQDLRGKVVMLFFGFTSCPDVCPLTLAELQQVKQQLGNEAEKFAVVFVTVDPQTDTIERLAEYIPAFDPSFYGVRMDEAFLANAKKAYGIYAEKVDHAEHAVTTNSDVQHSDYTLVIDTVGNWRVVYASEVEAQAITEDIKYLLSE